MAVRLSLRSQRVWHPFIKPPISVLHWNSRLHSTVAKTPSDIAAMLANPSWSVKALLKPNDNTPKEPISQQQLHHLLRLSALPLPKSEAEEARMISDLQSQLHFVQAIQKVDTKNVKPLQSIRDETEEAKQENLVTVESLQDEFAKEEVVGKRGRIRRRKDLSVDTEGAEDWDPLAQATRRKGRYFVVNTDKD